MRRAGIFWIASYPKSGNTWLRCLIAGLRTGRGAPDLNSLGTFCKNGSNIGWLGELAGFPMEDLTADEMTRLRPEIYRQWAVDGEGPRCLKIHDRHDPILFPADATAGTVLIVRDPRDVALSFAAHLNVPVDLAITKMGKPAFTLSRPSTAFRGQLPQVLGTWSDHVASWLDGAAGPLLLLRYEDLLAEPVGGTTRLAAFLGLPTDTATIGRAVSACRFDALRAAEEASGFCEKPDEMDRFFRQGQAGGWRRDLTPEQSARLVADHGAAMARLGYGTDE
jgi:hypothetical protein